MAPDTPIAIYSRQALAVLPDCPTWRLFGSQPASAIGREQPSVAPIASASSRNCATLDSSPTPRPIVRINGAVVISTSSAALTSVNFPPTARLVVAGAVKLVTLGAAAA